MPRNSFQSTGEKRRTNRPKIDPRLAMILSMPISRLRALWEHERRQIARLDEEITATAAELHRNPRDEKLRAKLQDLESRCNTLNGLARRQAV